MGNRDNNPFLTLLTWLSTVVIKEFLKDYEAIINVGNTIT